MTSRSRLTRLVTATLCVPLAACGIHTTRPVRAPQVRQLACGPHAHELVVTAKNGRRVRIGPRSELRFLQRDGRVTPWISGRRLHADRHAVYWRTRHGKTLTGLYWRDVKAAEVRNLSGGKTYGVIVATVVITAAIITLSAGLAVISGGRGRLNGLGRLILLPLKGIGNRHHHRKKRRLTDEKTDQKTNQETTASSSAVESQEPVKRIQAPRDAVPPAFTWKTRRRGWVRLVGALEGGTDLVLRDGLTSSAFIGVRLFNVLELAAGARLLMHPRADDDPRLRGTWMGVFRVLAHLDLDAARRIALPLGVDAGGGQPAGYVRIVLGLRVRAWRGLSLGLYPFNPTYTDLRGLHVHRGYSGWTFPTTLDVAFSY